jgi:hypothetical protein
MVAKPLRGTIRSHLEPPIRGTLLVVLGIACQGVVGGVITAVVIRYVPRGKGTSISPRAYDIVVDIIHYGVGFWLLCIFPVLVTAVIFGYHEFIHHTCDFGESIRLVYPLGLIGLFLATTVFSLG